MHAILADCVATNGFAHIGFGAKGLRVTVVRQPPLHHVMVLDMVGHIGHKVVYE